ncbi:MAG: zinc ribbon domain-containing protein [Thermoleophilia bacterium]
MQCPSCGGEVPDGASFCKHCGARLAAAAAQGVGSWPAEGQPPAGVSYGDPYAPAPPPPPRGGGRGLLIGLIVAALVILLLAAAAVAALIVVGRDAYDDPNAGTATPATATPDSRPTSTDDTEPPSASTTRPSSQGSDYTGEWIEMDLQGPPGDIYTVVVSDEAAVFETVEALFVLEFATGRLQQLPTEMESVGMVDIDGPQVVWWEGTYDDGLEEWTDGGIFAYRLPSGPRVQLAGNEGSLGFPLVAGGFVTWTQARPSTFSPEEVWEFPIFGLPITARESGLADPPLPGESAELAELLVPAPAAFVLGDSVWHYDLSPTYLAWEHHWDTADGDAGSYVRELRSGAETYLGTDSWRPSLAGSNVAYWRKDGLYLQDLETGVGQLLDPEGDWPALSEQYVAYLRAAQGADSYGWEIVTRGLTEGSEQVLGEQTTPPWFGSVISVAPHHLAFVDDEMGAHIFELRRR